MDRQLASIQKIIDIKPHNNADTLELATVLGWQVIVKKGEFQKGDLCVYMEIDSVLPPRPEFEFLANKRYRIRTCKLRGEVSQGICFPLTILKNNILIEEGSDVTKDLGVIKYIAPLPAQLMGRVRGTRPFFVPKTDETRIQSIPFVLDKYKNESFVVSEKLDGTSASFYLKDGDFGVCSRNMNLKETEENTYWQVARQYDIENKLRNLNKNIALQGEIIGNGIQKNKYNLEGYELYLFDIFDIDEFEYLDCNNFFKLVHKLHLKHVPIFHYSFMLHHSIDELLYFVNTSSNLNLMTLIEGMVFRPLKQIRDPKIGRLSFKIINNEFLLKYGE